MNDRFTEGDVVELKSGSPPMMIKVVLASEAMCEWMDARGKAQLGAFSVSSLRHCPKLGFACAVNEI